MARAQKNPCVAWPIRRGCARALVHTPIKVATVRSQPVGRRHTSAHRGRAFANLCPGRIYVKAFPFAAPRGMFNPVDPVDGQHPFPRLGREIEAPRGPARSRAFFLPRLPYPVNYTPFPSFRLSRSIPFVRRGRAPARVSFSPFARCFEIELCRACPSAERPGALQQNGEERAKRF